MRRVWKTKWQLLQGLWCHRRHATRQHNTWRPAMKPISSSYSPCSAKQGSVCSTEMRSVVDRWGPRVGKKQPKECPLCLRVITHLISPQRLQTPTGLSGKVEVHPQREELISSYGASGLFLFARATVSQVSSDCDCAPRDQRELLPSQRSPPGLTNGRSAVAICTPENHHERGNLYVSASACVSRSRLL